MRASLRDLRTSVFCSARPSSVHVRQRESTRWHVNILSLRTLRIFSDHKQETDSSTKGLVCLSLNQVKDNSEVPLSVPHSRDWFAEDEVLSDRSLDIAVRDMRWIIRCPRKGIFLPREILALNDSCEASRCVGVSASLCSEIVTFRSFVDFTPSSMQTY